MKVTANTKRILKYRRHVRDMKKTGWEKVGDNGSRLWELDCGGRVGQVILDCQISLCKKYLWVKIGHPTPQINSR